MCKASIVNVFFPDRGRVYPYFNDQFDLQEGDRVYVSGKLERHIGIVEKVFYSFKVDMQTYQKVIYQVDTSFGGNYYVWDEFFVTFDSTTLARSKVTRWFVPPMKAGDVLYIGQEDASFALKQFESLASDRDLLEEGKELYEQHSVLYFCLDRGKGYAIVQSTHQHQVEFVYQDGKISNLVCSCYHLEECKHKYALLYQLQDVLDWIRNEHLEEYEQTNYVAMIDVVELKKMMSHRKKKQECIKIQ